MRKKRKKSSHRKSKAKKQSTVIKFVKEEGFKIPQFIEKVEEKIEKKIDFGKLFGRTVTQERISQILEDYDKSSITIGVLGGPSGLDVCRGAKKHGFRTLAVCQRGREKTYEKYYKTRDNRGIIDEIILVNDFKDIVKKEVQQRLRELNTIFVHNRYFWVYCGFDEIEKKFLVPIFGTRGMVKLEERDVPKNQYYILEKAGIRIPKIFNDPKKIDKLVLVKVAEAKRGYERAFFFANNYEDYKKKSEELLKSKSITPESLNKAVIEEYSIGA